MRSCSIAWASGASVRVPANSSGRSLIEQAEGNPEVQEALRRQL
jgi:hypothetical protein